MYAKKGIFRFLQELYESGLNQKNQGKTLSRRKTGWT